MSVQDNILFGKVAYGRAEADRKVGELIRATLEELGLIDDIQRLGLRYHGGSAGARLSSVQRQKVAMVRSLIKDPDLVVLDQAGGVFDPSAEERLVGAVRKLREGKGLVWVLDRAELAKTFDHVLIVDRGRVIEQGSFKALAADSASELTGMLQA